MMKNTILILLMFLFANICFAQNAEGKDFQAIRIAMNEQEQAWNRGDIDAFMEHYWKSEDLQFIGSGGPTYGWQTTLENYKKRYPNRDAMGKLRFDIIQVNRRSKKVVTLLGKYTLERKNDQPSGFFILVWQKIKGKWLIVVDHTS
ncbi:MAG: nuclear transport factor 2 family protein [Saprospiraceae bacterium]|nr:nuclear transport factor 2 family protein [Saprospiraceae bacterium]